ncbi:MAG: UxaA family hydrolase [Acidobacteriota bacterium]
MADTTNMNVSGPIPFSSVGRVPSPGDNLAIAIRRLEAGTAVDYNGRMLVLDHTVLEGHRFVVEPIAAGRPLLSWGLPFGTALRDLTPGTYACNAQMLEALASRQLEFALPKQANFDDRIEPYRLNEARFQAAPPPPLSPESRTFQGFRRSGSRGVGTRNFIVLLGTSSRTAGFVRQLENRLKGIASHVPTIDGIVAAAHTEGGGETTPNNLELLLRTLAGFMVNPNVGAILAVDTGFEPVTNQVLQNYLQEHQYPIQEVLHHFLSLRGTFQAGLDEAESVVRGWLEPVGRMVRCEAPVSELRAGLQCGGSDAFSGISANPLLSWVAREIVRCGGCANLAETDELIGAESYVLQKVKDLETAKRFLFVVERFKERVAWHGSSAEANPSGGNKFRGLYNIVLKSIGAANKKHPEVRLDHVIDYAERMLQPGFYFMDSPGNDLESVAGQVAAGANLIFFTTGNGSVTNFPFVPTIKMVTTTRRFDLLSRDMDVNAGAYLDGTPMDELGRQTFDLSLRVASGERSAGERGGHSQVSIWRTWRQTDASRWEALSNLPQTDGKPRPIRILERATGLAQRFRAIRNGTDWTTDQVALILPTSLCASQIARMSADRLNQAGLGMGPGLSRYVALPHTEGCGASGGITRTLYTRTMLGYLVHPLVKSALLLEHGCEITHNDYMREQAEQSGIDWRRFGWASVQLDGGIERVLDKIQHWFQNRADADREVVVEPVGLEHLRIGLLAAGALSESAARSLAHLTSLLVGGGATVVVPENSALLTSVYREELLGSEPAKPSLSYGQRAIESGFHIMENPTDHWVETLTGLGATGVQMFLARPGQVSVQGHPLVPLLQWTDDQELGDRLGADLDLVVGRNPEQALEQLLELLLRCASRQLTPAVYSRGNLDFQLTRGWLGVSL